VVFTENDHAAADIVCAPETLVVDHGKAFLSAHVISVCTRLGISIQPAQPRKPTDKPTVERFFKTLREGLIQHLSAYKGPDLYSRGERVEDAAFLYLHELEEIIREWVALIYHPGKHEGLVVPEWPHLSLSPQAMFDIGVAKAGLLRIPCTPELVYDFLQVEYRTTPSTTRDQNRCPRPRPELPRLPTSEGFLSVARRGATPPATSHRGPAGRWVPGR
jgi:putative transposase